MAPQCLLPRFPMPLVADLLWEQLHHLHGVCGQKALRTHGSSALLHTLGKQEICGPAGWLPWSVSPALRQDCSTAKCCSQVQSKEAMLAGTGAGYLYIKDKSRGWRDGSVVKSAHCSFRELPLDSQHPGSGSQRPAAPFPGDLKPSPSLHGLCTNAVHINSHKLTHTHIHNK